jgi:hypothetical protein
MPVTARHHDHPLPYRGATDFQQCPIHLLDHVVGKRRDLGTRKVSTPQVKDNWLRTRPLRANASSRVRFRQRAIRRARGARLSEGDQVAGSDLGEPRRPRHASRPGPWSLRGRCRAEPGKPLQGLLLDVLD